MTYWLRIIGLYLSSSLLRLLIFFGITLLGLSIIVTNPGHIKNTFSSTGVYDNFVDDVLNDTVKANQNSSLPINDPEVQLAIKKSFNSELLKQSNEQIIDSFYDWLEGKSEKPVFNLDFRDQRKQISDKIAELAFIRLNNLPTCFAVPETIDPFTAGCRPPYTDQAFEQQKLSDQIAGPEGIMPDATFTNEDLPKNSNGLIIYERYSSAPLIYKWLSYLPFMLGVVLIGLSVAVVLLNKTKRKGFQQLGSIVIGSAITLLITPIVFNFILPKFNNALSFNTQSESTQALINRVTNQLTADFYTNILNIGIQLLALGIVILGIEKFTRPVSKYSDVNKKSGIASGFAKRSSKTNKKYRPSDVPIQSSEHSKRHRPRSTKNKKYRKIPKKEI
ncbi:hypothetical protein KDA00_02635 [Candidatus Saccharibacteria bacterium]|nr:hypothetical protein [Candidatus Saccharibacteria bacterium]